LASYRKRDFQVSHRTSPGPWSYLPSNSFSRLHADLYGPSGERQSRGDLSAIKTKVEQEKILGVKHVADISFADLLKRYKRHQKARVKATTFERLDGIVETLKRHLPERLKDVTKRAVADFISERSTEVAAGSVQKELSVLKHALKLAVE
jgi:hypothetical protein